MKDIKQLISITKTEIESSPSPQRLRYLKNKLYSLIDYYNLNPSKDKITEFEYYCIENPDSLECKIYDV